jgi:hypothetical protein
MLPGMKPNKNRAITLVELIISIVLLGMVMLGFYGIDMFSRQQFLAADKRSKVQNEATFVLSHISKHMLTVIGDVDNPALVIANSGLNTTSIFAVNDTHADGVRNLTDDLNLTYCFNNATCNAAAQPYTLVFVPVPAATAEVLARHVQVFNVTQNGNYLTMQISTCWQPSGTPKACGTLDNPSMNLTNIIKMPSVSAQ